MDANVASNSGGERGPGQGKRKRDGEEKEKELSVIADYGRRRSLCDYCSSSSPSKISHGLWAYNLTSKDYQDLVDRGWRRSGCVVYKPEMDKTCCPQYTIRLKASDFNCSKDQDRVLKKMQRYLDGELDSKFDKSYERSKSNLLREEPDKSSDYCKPSNTGQTSLVSITVPPKAIENQEKFISFLSDIIDGCINTFLVRIGLPLTGQNPKSVVRRVKPQMKRKLKGIVTKEEDLVYTCNVSFQITSYIKKVDSKINSLDSISPKIIAEELARTISSQNLSGSSIKACNGHLNFHSEPKQETVVVESVEKPVQPQETLKRDYDTHKKRRRLEIRMKRSEFDPDEYVLYEKYQKLVHQDTEVSIDSYIKFLVDTPIPFVEPDGSSRIPPCGLGSFHQQYLLDGRIIAVGVVDILPKCLSSKYLFWDPDFAFLSLGKFTALKEIQWVREIQAHCPSLEYYYLGYYIHSCEKMQYKAAYRPSELLCPLRFEWVPYDIAKPLLDRSKYVILSDIKTTLNTHLLPVEKPGTCFTRNIPHRSGVHNEMSGYENGEKESAEDEYFMHEDYDMGQDKEKSFRDMDDNKTGADLLADQSEIDIMLKAVPTEHPSFYSTTEMHHHGGVHLGGNCGNDHGSIHEDSDVGPDGESSSRDMNDGSDEDNDNGDANNDDDYDEDDYNDYSDDDEEISDDLSGDDAETINDIVVDMHNIRVRYKELQKILDDRRNFLSKLAKQLYRFIELVGKDLSSRIVYSIR
ncbi:hypothetical protein LUZ61_013846 [Rhynchospora tenuis]|uniref:arginyltransferase n=1 Tax=Rhynchospora tenuis TaxID=198213 RepID=A0AAD5Z259_9POAL|nr:hypothetical protein LUZ61_013846 [Rhynchospora tenuis]